MNMQKVGEYVIPEATTGRTLLDNPLADAAMDSTCYSNQQPTGGAEIVLRCMWRLA
jgi:hypothetical protein